MNIKTQNTKTLLPFAI